MWEIWLAASVTVLVIVVVLHERSIRRRFTQAQAETQENRAMDRKIVRLYKEIEEMLDSFEEYVGEVHEEMESRRSELLTMSRQATTLYMQVMQPGVFASKPQAEEEPPPEPREKAGKKEPRPAKKGEPPAEEGKTSRLSQRDRAELDRLTGKGQKIRYLTGKGLNMNEVARELDIGKGEIRLILDLDKD